MHCLIKPTPHSMVALSLSLQIATIIWCYSRCICLTTDSTIRTHLGQSRCLALYPKGITHFFFFFSVILPLFNLGHQFIILKKKLGVDRPFFYFFFCSSFFFFASLWIKNNENFNQNKIYYYKSKNINSLKF